MGERQLQGDGCCVSLSLLRHRVCASAPRVAVGSTLAASSAVAVLSSRLAPRLRLTLKVPLLPLPTAPLPRNG